MSDRGSVSSLDSLASEGLPVSPSLLYDQRERLYETRRKQGRKAITEYSRVKSSSAKKQDESPEPIFHIGIIQLPSVLYSTSK
jgi:hypothetical protein